MKRKVPSMRTHAPVLLQRAPEARSSCPPVEEKRMVAKMPVGGQVGCSPSSVLFLLTSLSLTASAISMFIASSAGSVQSLLARVSSSDGP